MNQPPSPSPDPREGRLDSEITSIRSQIRALHRRRRVLTSSLLTSDPIQKLLQRPRITTSLDNISSISPLVRAAGTHSDSNHHRVAFGTTAFPFKDPSPTSSGELLGLRIDICARNGRFTKPYYVLLRRERTPRSAGAHAGAGRPRRLLRVYRHTVPAFISIARLEQVYLPPSRRDGDWNGEERGESMDPEDEEEEEDDDGPLKPWKQSGKAARKQDVRGFVRELRRELVAWHVRVDAVDLLREKLALTESSKAVATAPVEGTGIVSLSSTALEARYVRLEWEDGRVGRFKLSNTGLVERAVVIGDQGRDKKTEEAMTGSGGRAETILERLREAA
ncbi:hypothetical protein N7474_005912 [Penicillium riverlandense]|uniref:uncharacterized protein n=1 Tax=Penicillium riverlandense TaxID=1903569 RepID=UPI002547E63A|nr:uncharacterized protein N7474_005912 [Penicillium riverlandense]KAJ5820321.1 hypothetical protein N7474_005912 [Penicillium riverlandense]